MQAFPPTCQHLFYSPRLAPLELCAEPHDVGLSATLSATITPFALYQPGAHRRDEETHGLILQVWLPTSPMSHSFSLLYAKDVSR
jgi:hypothetical protein